MRHDAKRVEQRAAEWLIRQDRPNWTAADEAGLEAWLADTGNRVSYLRVRATWDRLEALQSADRDWVCERRRRPASRWAWPIGLAASLLFAVGGWTWVGFHNVDPSARFSARLAESSWETARTDIGQIRSISLRDGTRIHLNTNAEIQATAGQDFRAVRLIRGEAFFDVAHDKIRPFHIFSNGREVKVLGTKFGVRRNHGSLEIAVIEGQVLVSDNGGPTAVLSRNDFARADDAGILVRHESERQILDRLSWRQGNIVFSNITLGEAATEINRYNRKKLLIADEVAAKVRIGGTFDPRNLTGFIRLMGTGFDLKVIDQGDKVTISTKGG